MSQTDMVNNLKVVTLITPGVYKSGADVTPIWVDTAGYESVTVVTQAGTVTDSQTLALKYSANANGSSPVAMAGTDVIGGSVTAINALTATTDNGAVKKVGLLERTDAKRYIALTCTGAGTTGAPISASVILANPRSKPAT